MPASARSSSSRQLRLPIHDYAADHKLLRALRQYKTKQRLNAFAQRRDVAEVAAERIRELAWDYGADKDHHLWMADAARRLGANYETLRRICKGETTRVGLKVVQQIQLTTGLPIGLFYDEEL